MDVKYPIYLDYNSTTPIDPRVLEAMMPFLTDLYGNASSSHRFGKEINNKVNLARESIAKLINADPEELIYTSSATESINLALKGLIHKSKKKHIITVFTEHPAVLDTCKYLENIGIDVSYLNVDSDGIIDLYELKKTIRKDTLLVSVLYVNNETGVIQPIKEISEIAHYHQSLFMTDGTQAIGKFKVDVHDLGIDIMAFSGHKFYGPKGIGALYYNSKKLRSNNFLPIIHGGGHERNLRSGTLNVPGIIGMSKAAEIAFEKIESDQIEIRKLRDKLENSLLKLPGVKVNGQFKKRVYTTSNLLFKDIDNEAFLLNLDEIYVSNGSACSSGSMEPSHVLIKMGLKREEANSSIRFSLGRFNTEEEIDFTVTKIQKITDRLNTVNTK